MEGLSPKHFQDLFGTSTKPLEKPPIKIVAKPTSQAATKAFPAKSEEQEKTKNG